MKRPADAMQFVPRELSVVPELNTAFQVRGFCKTPNAGDGFVTSTYSNNDQRGQP
jgi:hypothetical protein